MRMQHGDREGVFWGIVNSANDPENRYRVECRVPDVQGEELTEWAEPDSMILAPLKPGDKVWIRYLGGDFRHPIYHIPYDRKRGFIWNAPENMLVKNPSGSITINGTTVTVTGSSSSVVTTGGKVHNMGPNGSGYVPSVASEFEVASNPGLKHDIRDVDFDPVEVVKNAPAKLWKYKHEHSPDQRDRIGPMLDDLPELARSGENVSTQALIGILWAAVSELAKKVEKLEQQISESQNN